MSGRWDVNPWGRSTGKDKTCRCIGQCLAICQTYCGFSVDICWTHKDLDWEYLQLHIVDCLYLQSHCSEVSRTSQFPECFYTYLIK